MTVLLIIAAYMVVGAFIAATALRYVAKWDGYGIDGNDFIIGALLALLWPMTLTLGLLTLLVRAFYNRGSEKAKHR